MSALKRFFDPGGDGGYRDFGLLCLRLGLGFSLAYGHGWGKLLKMLDGNFKFGDPLGLGAGLSLGLVTFSEFFCAIAIAVGFMTRLATVPMLILFSVAAFIVHADDPFQTKEKALLFLIGYLALLFTGPGRLSVDQKLRRR